MMDGERVLLPRASIGPGEEPTVIRIQSSHVRRWRSRQLLLLLGAELNAERRGHLTGDVALYLEEILRRVRAVVAFRPELLSLWGVGERHREAHLAAGALDRSPQQREHAELRRDLTVALRAAPVLERRCPRCDLEAGDLRELGDHLGVHAAQEG